MFTSRKYANKDQSAKDYVCLSTDEKPTDDITNGSMCLEMDTGKLYAFDAVSGNWLELA